MDKDKFIQILKTSICEHNCQGYKDSGGKCFFDFNCSTMQNIDEHFSQMEQSYQKGVKDCLDIVDIFIRTRLPRVIDYNIDGDTYFDMLNEDIREDLKDIIKRDLL